MKIKVGLSSDLLSPRHKKHVPAAVAIATISVWLFLSCRLILAVGEAGNFPAAIKATAEYFPKKDRAFSTSIFNSGASVGALAVHGGQPS